MLGNIFSFETAYGKKRYFQYICNDISCMNTQVIRVFKTVYSAKDNPPVEKIVADEIDFYAHTIVRVGIIDNVWHKVETSNDLGLDKLNKITFVLFFTADELTGLPSIQTDRPLWKIWKSNERIHWCSDINEMSPKYLEIGSILPIHQIVNRLNDGFYTFTANEYNVLFRRPYDGVQTFTKRSYCGCQVYFHFNGENLKNIIMVSADNSIVTNMCDILCQLGLPENLRFGDINWKFSEYISEKEYDAVL